MKTFKILISRISDGTLGGAEMSAFDQARILHGMGYEVIYVSNLPKLIERAQGLGVRTAELPWIQRGQPPLRYILFWLLYPWFTARALWLVYRHRPDIINPHSREDQIIYTLTKWLHGRPVVWKDAGDLRHLLKPERLNPIARIYEGMLKRAIRKADYIYLLNQGDVGYIAGIVGAGVEDKMTNVPSSILYDDYDLDASPHLRPDDKVVIGYIGRVGRIKGLKYLLEASRQINRDDVEYWIVGDGDYKNELIAQTKKSGNFKFFDFTDDVPSHLNTFDIFVQPAEFEGWGRNVKEAMYLGLPVVGSNSGGVGQQLDHEKTGLVFEPGNSDSLAEQLLRVIEDRNLRQKLGRAAKAKADQDGDFRTIVEKQILPIYEKCLGGD
jgi:glycosyltransferase involved in cell wall biosynthesis